MPGHQTQGQETLVFADELCRPEGKRRQKRTWVSVRQAAVGSLRWAASALWCGLACLTCFVPVSISHYPNGHWLQGRQELRDVFLEGKEMCFPFCLFFFFF